VRGEWGRPGVITGFCLETLLIHFVELRIELVIKAEEVGICEDRAMQKQPQRSAWGPLSLWQTVNYACLQ
jgi:hypothetical protein